MGIALVVLFLLAVLLLLSLTGFAGGIGRALAGIMFGLFGIGAWAVPPYLFIMCILLLTGRGGSRMPARMLAVAMLILAAQAAAHLRLHAVHLVSLEPPLDLAGTFSLCSKERSGGGIIGAVVSWALYRAFHMAGSCVVLVGIALIAILLMLQRSPLDLLQYLRLPEDAEGGPGFRERRRMARQRRWQEREEEREAELEREAERILRQEDAAEQRQIRRMAREEQRHRTRRGAGSGIRRASGPRDDRASGSRKIDPALDLEHTRLGYEDAGGTGTGKHAGYRNSARTAQRSAVPTRDVHEITVLDVEEDLLTIPAGNRTVERDYGTRQEDISGEVHGIPSAEEFPGRGSTPSAEGFPAREGASPAEEFPGRASATAAGRSGYRRAGIPDLDREAGHVDPAFPEGSAGGGPAGSPIGQGQFTSFSEFGDPEPAAAGSAGRYTGAAGVTGMSAAGYTGAGMAGRTWGAAAGRAEGQAAGKRAAEPRPGTVPDVTAAFAGSGATDERTAPGGSGATDERTVPGGSGVTGESSAPAGSLLPFDPSEEDLQGISVHRDADSKNRPSGPAGKTAVPVRASTYAAPPFSILERGTGGKNPETERELKETAYRLQETLRTFGVQVKITDISQGPSVTRYELLPDSGVKVSRIVNLSDDIKLRLAATDIRIEAPIPGKSAIGIEVPNKHETTVHLRELLESRDFRRSEGKLPMAVGKDIAGKTVIADIARMPHLLIAGATGSGKSVCINTIILSILYKTSPDKVKLLMIDPKVVELSVYKGIPHLIIPVVTDARKASAALNWAVAEMEKRYKLFAAAGVRDLNGYNHLAETFRREGGEPEREPMPRLVIIVDELADLMMVSKNEVESAICRLAQLARAAGIHLIIATQRPSVDVITGLIKANMPSRIAFAVSSQVDSRTILDMAGAEKLIGKGDMLFYPQNYPKPRRIQGAFVSDDEVTRVVDYIHDHNALDGHDQEIAKQIETIAEKGLPASGGNTETGTLPGRDEYFEKAGRYVIEKNKASIGLLQRVYKIGFNRAARIMDQLAEAGVVSEESSTRARTVLMTLPEFENYLENES